MNKEQKKSIKDMTSFSDLRKKWMKDPEFKKAYDDLEPEFAIVRAMIKMRLKNKMSQKDLAKKLGTKQPAIARFESGAYNPTLSFLKKLSTALGGKLEIKI
ncbi:MAG: helix-turn-helix transcriptional regulator [Candidatus Nomurabacteria bacterium]|nr:helix-turn-helix transcriptional regulator [Candidatus Nomurabacteria bacterium]